MGWQMGHDHRALCHDAAHCLAKEKASVASGTIIKEQEWTVHIKQHKPTCEAADEEEEEERE